jgi:hypothetical protein
MDITDALEICDWCKDFQSELGIKEPADHEI